MIQVGVGGNEVGYRADGCHLDAKMLLQKTIQPKNSSSYRFKSDSGEEVRCSLKEHENIEPSMILVPKITEGMYRDNAKFSVTQLYGIGWPGKSSATWPLHGSL